MPLSPEQKAWAEKKIAAGVPKEQVFEFLASQAVPQVSAPPSINLQSGVPLMTPRLEPRPTEPRPSPTEFLGPLGGTEREQRQMLLEGSLMGLTGGLGGLAGRAFLGPLLTRPLGAAIGEAVGTTAGGRLAGMPQGEALNAGLIAGGLGGAVEAGGNIGARVVGSTLSTPESVISETLRLPVRRQMDVMFRTPNGMPERDIGLVIQRKLAEGYKTLSPGRLTKMNVMQAAERSGVKVPITDLQTAIKVGIADADMAVGRANSSASSRLQMLEESLSKKFPSGTLTPSQADAQLRAFQRDAEMAAARNNPFLAQTYRNLKDSLRKSFFGAVDKALPGSNISKATAEANAYMKSLDTLGDFISDKTPETFVRSLFSGEEGAQSALVALRDVEKQLGTGGQIERSIHDLSLKRKWTQEETGRAFSAFRAFEKSVAKPLTKGLIIGSRPAGQAAASIPAFMQAMKAEDNP